MGKSYGGVYYLIRLLTFYFLCKMCIKKIIVIIRPLVIQFRLITEPYSDA
eukprot:UN09623